MNIVTSIGLFDDAIGKRISLTYSQIDDTGKIISDNKRIDRVVTDTTVIENINAVKAYAASLIEE
jgi:hypothetical protein